MIDHTGLIASDFARSKAWCTNALAAVGYALLMEFPRGDTTVAGFGATATGKPDFWLVGATADRPATKPSLHIAFGVGNRAQVDAFHAAALAAGGRDNGAPGVRAQYHPSYHGAFVLDPDGNNIEAVCHAAA